MGTFLRNDPGFSHEDVVAYINSALQNEAADLWQSRIENLKTIRIWQRHVHQLTGGFEDVGVAEAKRRLGVMIQEDDAQYALDRINFGAAVLLALDQVKDSLTQETREWVIRLDHDRHLTYSMGTDVKSVFGSGLECLQTPTAYGRGE